MKMYSIIMTIMTMYSIKIQMYSIKVQMYSIEILMYSIEMFEFPPKINFFNKIFKHYVFDVKAAKDDFEISVQIIVYFWSDHHVTRNQN